MSVEIFTRYGWRVTSPYGWRVHPIYHYRGFHRGIDLVKPHQHPIPAFIGGRVIFAGMGQGGTGFGGYGNVVAVRDQWGHTHVYSHLHSIGVQPGQTIPRGHIVGTQGATGIATGSHLHYEVRARSSPSWGWMSDVDPGQYLASRRYPVTPEHTPNRVVTLVFRGRPLPWDGVLIGNTSYVPVRWFAENMGMKVQWSEDTGGTVWVE